MQTTLLPVGQDDGHDTIKTCFGYDPSSKQYKYGYHKSRAVEGLQQVMAVGDTGGVAYETEGSQFTVADGQALIKTLDTRFNGYPTSNLNRTLVTHALASCGLGGQKLYLVTGLPVDQYYRDSKPNTSLIDEKKASLGLPVARLGKGPETAIIAKQSVVSEAIAAFYDALIKPDGSIDDDIRALISRRPVAVVDMGGKTLDIAVVVENVGGVYGERSGTENTGVLSLMTKAVARFKAHFNLSNDPPLAYVEEALRTKKYELFGEEHDVAQIVADLCRDHLNQVKNFFLKKVGDGSDLGAVMFVGGGTALIHNALGEEAFATVYQGKRIIAHEPEYANARGMWKFASFVVAADDRAIPAELSAVTDAVEA